MAERLRSAIQVFWIDLGPIAALVELKGDDGGDQGNGGHDENGAHDGDGLPVHAAAEDERNDTDRKEG